MNRLFKFLLLLMVPIWGFAILSYLDLGRHFREKPRQDIISVAVPPPAAVDATNLSQRGDSDTRQMTAAVSAAQTAPAEGASRVDQNAERAQADPRPVSAQKDDAPAVTADTQIQAPSVMDATTPGDRHLPSLQPLPEAEINGLIRRGEAAFALGNLALAREAFERVTDAGNALGALRLGQTFDPAVLAAAKLDKEPTDPGKAVYWYNRAHELALASAPEKIPPTPTTERTPPPVSTAARPIETVPPAAAGSATSTEIPEGAGTSSGSASPVASVVTPDIAVTAPVSRENGSELAVVTPQNNAVAPVTAAPATAASNDTQAVAANRGASIVNASKLIARGDTMFATGDVSSARLFYERAVNSGDGAAALRLGETFDPDFLARIGYIGAAADRGKAVQWYRYARSLGIADADILLNTAETTANK